MQIDLKSTVGDRIRQCLAQCGLSQTTLAAQIGLTDSQLSKSLTGLRAFSAVELASAADVLGVSMYWLVTGEADQMELKIAARHSFEASCGEYRADMAPSDSQVLADVALLYRQAYGQ